MPILVTGASGFIGQRLTVQLANQGRSVIGVVRSGSVYSPRYDTVSVKRIEALDEATEWSHCLRDVSSIVHCAAVAHEHPGDVWSVNVAGALNLARQAAKAGVQRFVFISSIGVNGNISTSPFSEKDTPIPAGLYAQSKWEAEQRLWDIQRDSGMQVVILRPPLVYGPNAPGNFGSLVQRIDKSVPLPLGAINNKRSLIALDNLVDLIITCVDHPAAANQVFLASDGQDVSTTELLRGVGQAMGKPARLIPVPAGMLMFGSSLLGKKAAAQRLLGSLQVDISKARNVLGWEPPLSVEEGLRRCFVSEIKR
jgi:nucleoside-diphosphate-sugar epimerase